MQRFDSVREKDFNIHFYSRNRNYIQYIESDCRNKGESLSFAHSFSGAWLDFSCKRTQFGILVQLKSKFIWSILINVEGFHASWTFLVLQQRQNLGQKFGTNKMHLTLSLPSTSKNQYLSVKHVSGTPIYWGYMGSMKSISRTIQPIIVKLS